MTTANKLTILRVLMIPAFLAVLYWGFPGSRYVALAIYVVACLTDLLDGYIARQAYGGPNFPPGYIWVPSGQIMG